MPPNEKTKKSRPKDVFGRNLPTEEQFEALKNAPRSRSFFKRLCFVSVLVSFCCVHTC